MSYLLGKATADHSSFIHLLCSWLLPNADGRICEHRSWKCNAHAAHVNVDPLNWHIWLIIFSLHFNAIISVYDRAKMNENAIVGEIIFIIYMKTHNIKECQWVPKMQRGRHSLPTNLAYTDVWNHRRQKSHQKFIIRHVLLNVSPFKKVTRTHNGCVHLICFVASRTGSTRLQ